jgi:flap endonuclease-1
VSTSLEPYGYPCGYCKLCISSDYSQLIYELQAPSEAEAQCAELARGGKVILPIILLPFVKHSILIRCLPQVQRIWIPSPLTRPLSTGILRSPRPKSNPFAKLISKPHLTALEWIWIKWVHFVTWKERYLSYKSQFIDLCILLGCDYLEPIKGVGPKSALKLVKEHGNLKEVVKHLRAK